MNSIKCYKDCNSFIDHPLAPLFYQFVETLEKRGFYKEAEDLQKIAEKYYLPENRTIILKIIIEMQRAAVSDEETKLEQLLQQL
ncbi:hypothetical protein Megvenef_01617 [Candidatus Megaera venefica]|jgi:hypothetical protein|uniref:Uncharacterized protein n=1 Tax=Candidatus Megaera venefica TaxID=2055910 RepID=A0ABU5NET1_9RICK|nr:hypothetical protein [Candidatus Megaera venefica]MEA0971633.1 hypothetical protein [Candidatus Megaera venefica]